MFRIRDKILVTPPSIVIMLLIIISVFFGIYTITHLRREKLKDFQQSTKTKSEEIVEFLRSIEKDVVSLSNNMFFLNLFEAVARGERSMVLCIKQRI